jgi:hypothetical protein
VTTTVERERASEPEGVAARNTRIARWLLLWIAFLMLVSLAVIWLRN